MTEASDLLQQLGFSQYEAQAYYALLHENPVNGYELAKSSGIPRSNIYLVLQKLEERGAVLRLDSPEGTRYAPVPPSELLARLRRRFENTVDSADQVLRDAAAPAAQDSILNVRGYNVIIDQVRTLIQTARQALLVSLWPDEAHTLADVMQEAQNRGVRMTTLCLRGCPVPCPACQGAVFRYPLAPASAGRWLVCVADHDELLAAEITPNKDALAVRTRQKMLVNLTGSYIQNSIALASILTSLGGQLEQILDPQTRDALDTLQPFNSQGRWLDELREMIQTQEKSS